MTREFESRWNKIAARPARRLINGCYPAWRAAYGEAGRARCSICSTSQTYSATIVRNREALLGLRSQQQGI